MLIQAAIIKLHLLGKCSFLNDCYITLIGVATFE
jgi:hypothetical protein